MSTKHLRERLRQISLLTAPSNTNTASSLRNDEVAKENSVLSQQTQDSSRFIRSATLSKSNKNDINASSIMIATPSINRPATTGMLEKNHKQERMRRHRHLSVIGSNSSDEMSNEKPSASRQGNAMSAASLPPRHPSNMEAAAAATRSSSVNERQKATSVGKYVMIHGKSYLLIDLLGKGGSSKVYQVLDEVEKKCRAVKCVDLTDADNATRDAYLNEIKLLVGLKDSGCVVQLFDYELRGNHLYMVMEKGDTDLSTFLRTRRSKIDHIFIRFYWNEMLKCVNAIHNKGVIHSDLKPANFLLIGGNLKLIDFGIASSIPSNRTSVMKDSRMGTISYMPPEALEDANQQNGKETYKVQRKSDVWSLGCILYNMVYGRTPYESYLGCARKMNAILHKPVEFDVIDDLELLDVMKKCLEKNPLKRASVEELQQHPYLKKTKTESLNESSVFKDEDYLLRVAEDLRTCTPRTSARKLKYLMSQQRHTTNVKACDHSNGDTKTPN